MEKLLLIKTFSSLPTLKTERLILRKMSPSDAEDMFEYAHLEEVTRYLLWSPHNSIAHTKEYLKYIKERYSVGDFYDWAVIDKEASKMIGTCGFTKIDAANNSAEIGYVLNPEYHRKGLAPEAAKAVIDFGFKVLGLNRIEARFIKGNTPSLRVMEKLGMTFEGYARQAALIKGEYHTIGTCCILKSEYK